MSEINQLHTSCKNCIFAIYDGITQIDCVAGQIQKFKDNSIEIIEAEDNEKQFYVINNKLCRLARSKSWQERQKTKNLTKLLTAAKKESVIKYHLIVNIDTDIKKLQKFIKNINKQTIQPQLITLVRPFNSNINLQELLELLRKQSFKWKIENLGDGVDYNKGVDIAVKNSESTFYAVFNSSAQLNNTLFSTINKKINSFEEFVITAPDSKCDGWLALLNFHKLNGGNKGGQTLYEFAISQGIPCPKTNELINQK